MSDDKHSESDSQSGLAGRSDTGSASNGTANNGSEDERPTSTPPETSANATVDNGSTIKTEPTATDSHETTDAESTTNADGSDPDLDAPEYYLSRELSKLQFNERVLAEAADERNPLLERIKFLSIFTRNMDEFL